MLAEGVYQFQQLLRGVSTLAGGGVDLGGDGVDVTSTTVTGGDNTASPLRPPTAPSTSTPSNSTPLGQTGATAVHRSALEQLLSPQTLLFDIGLAEAEGRFSCGLVFQVCVRVRACVCACVCGAVAGFARAAVLTRLAWARAGDHRQRRCTAVSVRQAVS